jgi:hypothetical protein
LNGLDPVDAGERCPGSGGLPIIQGYQDSQKTHWRCSRCLAVLSSDAKIPEHVARKTMTEVRARGPVPTEGELTIASACPISGGEHDLKNVGFNDRGHAIVRCACGATNTPRNSA